MRAILIYVLLAISGILPCAAQNAIPTPQFKHFNFKNGLPSDQVLCIYQDSKGFIWFGTENGLAKFDGYDFESFLFHNADYKTIKLVVQDISETDNGDLWLALGGYGVSKWDREKNSFTNHRQIPNKVSINNDKVWNIQVSNEQDVFIGHSNGLSVLQKDTVMNFLPGEEKAQNGKYVYSFLEKEGQMWIGSNKGLARYDATKNEVINLDETNKLRIFKMFDFDDDNMLLMNHNSPRGGFLYNIRSKQLSPFLSDEIELILKKGSGISSVAKDERGLYWIGTFSNGLIIYDPATENYKHIFYDTEDKKSLLSNNIQTILLDKNGGIWIACYNGGVCYYDNKRSSKFILIDDNVTSVQAFNNQICLGTSSSGLHFYNMDGSFNRRMNTSNSDLTSNDIRELGVNCDDSKLYIGTNIGLYDITPEYELGQGIEVNNLKTANISSIGFDKDCNLIVGTKNNGVYINGSDGFKNFTVKNEGNSLSHRAVLSASYSDDNLWVGTLDGLNKIDLKTEQIKNYSFDLLNSSSISDPIIFSLFHKKDGNLLVGTNNGLDIYDAKNDNFINLSSEKLHQEFSISDVYESPEGYLFVCTPGGMYAYDEDYQLLNNSFFPDIQFYNNHSALTLPDSTILFCGKGGCIRLDPKNLNKKSKHDSIQVLECAYFEQSLGKYIPVKKDDSNKYNFTHNQSKNLKFTVSTFSYSDDMPNIYYSTNGSSENMYPNGKSRNIIISGLKNGNHKIYFGTDPSVATASIELYNKPHFSQSKLAFLFYIGFAALSIYLFRKYQGARQKRLVQVRKKLKQDYHDDLGNSITSISLLTNVLQHKSEDNEELFNDLNLHISHLKQGFRDFLFFLDRNECSGYELASRIKTFCESLFKYSDTSFSCTGIPLSLKEVIIPIDDSKQLLLMFKEIANNAAKYSEADKCLFECIPNGGSLQMVLRDDGKGFELQNVEEKRGISYIQERSKLIGADLDINSEKGSGTQFQITYKP